MVIQKDSFIIRALTHQRMLQLCLVFHLPTIFLLNRMKKVKISSNNPLRRYNTTIMIRVQRVLATGRISVYVDKDGSF